MTVYLLKLTGMKPKIEFNGAMYLESATPVGIVFVDDWVYAEHFATEELARDFAQKELPEYTFTVEEREVEP